MRADRSSAVVLPSVFLLALLGLTPGSMAASPPALLWQTAFDSYTQLGGNGDDIMNDVAPTDDGGAVAAGYAVPPDTALPRQAYVLRLDAAGSVIWRTYLGDGSDGYEARRVKRAPDGGFLVACTASTQYPEGAPGIWFNRSFVAKLDAGGTELWRWSFDPLSLDEIGDIDVLPDGSVLAAGRVFDAWGTTYTAVSKLSATGSLLWTRKEYPAYISGVFRVAASADHGLFVACGDPVFATIARYTSDGNLLWMTAVEGVEGSGFYSEKIIEGVTPAPDGGCVAAGGARTVNWDGSYGPFQPFLATFNAFGQQTATLVVPTASAWLHAVERLADGGLFAAEGVSSPDGGVDFVRYDGSGSELWRASYGAPSASAYARINAVRETPDGRLVAAGAVPAGSSAATSDGYVLVLGERAPPGVSGDIVVRIDVLPGNPRNVVNYTAQGQLPVALLSSPEFDARAVDLSTVTLEGVPVTRDGRNRFRAVVQDVDSDGLKDVLLFFSLRSMALSPATTEVTMEGAAPGGGSFCGSDRVRIVGRRLR